MSTGEAQGGAPADSSSLVWHFTWMQEAYEDLRRRIASIRSRVEAPRSGNFWGAIEDDENHVAGLLLMLQTNSIPYPWLIPVTRTYMYADGSRISLGEWPGGEDGRDRALVCRITISSPQSALLGVHAPAPMARGGDMSPSELRNMIVRPDGAGESYQLLSKLTSLYDETVIHHLQTALAQWQQAIEAQADEIAPPPTNRVRRLATLLPALYRDIEWHRFRLLQCEKRRSSFFGNDSSLELTDRQLIHWQRYSSVIDASHKRINRHLLEMRPLADGLAAELEYGMRDDAGPTETRLMHALKQLYDRFHPRATNPIPDPDNGSCGYLWWHFDGQLHESFKAWWVPIADELLKAADILATVSLGPDGNGAMGAPKGVDKENSQIESADTGTTRAEEMPEQRNAEGRVLNPTDKTAYLSAERILNDHTPPRIAHTRRQLRRVLDRHTDTVRQWRPRSNRLCIHLADWLQYVEGQRQDTDDEGWATPAEVEMRKAAFRDAKYFR